MHAYIHYGIWLHIYYVSQDKLGQPAHTAFGLIIKCLWTCVLRFARRLASVLELSRGGGTGAHRMGGGAEGLWGRARGRSPRLRSRQNHHCSDRPRFMCTSWSIGGLPPKGRGGKGARPHPPRTFQGQSRSGAAFLLLESRPTSSGERTA